MNAKHGKPAGTTGTITFDVSRVTGVAPTRVAVRDEQGNCWVNVQGALWLPCNAEAADRFVAA